MALDEVCAAKHWANHEGWHVKAYVRACAEAASRSIGMCVYLNDVRRNMAHGAGGESGDLVAVRPQATPHAAARTQAAALGTPSLAELALARRVLAGRAPAWPSELFVARTDIRVHKGATAHACGAVVAVRRRRQ